MDYKQMKMHLQLGLEKTILINIVCSLYQDQYKSECNIQKKAQFDPNLFLFHYT